MLLPAATLALAGALAAPPAADPGDGPGDGPSLRAMLHVRATALGNVPATDVRFDRDANAFDLSRYLVGTETARHASAFAAFSAEGTALGGDLAWRVALDTGELRTTRYPDVTTVCLVGFGTGLAHDAPLACAAARKVDVEDTRLQAARPTANGRPVADELRATAFVREAYAALSFGRAGFATLRAGRKRISVADGFVYDDYATGAELALDVGAIGPPLAVTASVFQPTRDLPARLDGVSPLAALRLDWLPSLFEHAGVFAAVHRDRTGSVAELFRGAIVERAVAYLQDQPPATVGYRVANRRLAGILGQPLESDATLAWFGTSGRLVPRRGQRLGWTAALLRGRIDRVATGSGAGLELARDVRVDGRMLSLSWSADLGGKLGAGASFLYLSGGEFPRVQDETGTYRGFLGVAPFVTATNLFFSGGLSESFAARQSTAPGVNGRGVAAPALSLSYAPVKAVGIDLAAAYLVAPVAGPFGGRAYGTEADAEISWALRDGVILALELDALWPGDFYLGTRTVYKAVVGLDLVTP